MSIKKLIDVCKPVMTRARVPYQEAKTTPDGHIMLTDGTSKRPDQVLQSDDIQLAPVPMGKLLTMALDKTDDKLSPEERRKRFSLSVRVEDAIVSGEMLSIDVDDRKRLEAAADMITNHLFLYRIHEAIELAQPEGDKPKVRVKANGAHEEAAPLAS